MADDVLTFRVMTAADIESVPLDHQGSADEVLARIDDLGSAAALVFDGPQHVGQLQFRRYNPELRSPNGLHDPLYWGDFSAIVSPELPEQPAQARAAPECCYRGCWCRGGGRRWRYR